MKEFELSMQILERIEGENVYFADALKDMFQKDPDIRPYRREVAGLVGCALRHDLLFAKLLSPLSELPATEKRAMALGLANAYYFRHFDRSEFDSEVKKAIDPANHAFYDELSAKAGHSDEYIPADVDHSKLEYLSLRYNIPVFALKIMHHYGYSNMFKTAKRLIRPYVQYVRFRDLPELDELRQSPDFLPTPVKDVYSYLGKQAIRRLPQYRDRKLFDVRPAVKQLLADNKVSAPCTVLAYLGENNGGADCELVAEYGNEVSCYIATPKAEKLLECNRLISSLNLRNFKVFDYNDKVSLEANVSSKCDLVICLPASTGFDSIATTPDFFLHFDKEAMDARLKEQAESLDSCAEYVEEGGTLLYGVLTISKKEGAQNVAEFLKKHPEFTLEQEKQCFPFEELGTAFYFAKLKKGNKLATIEVPVAELGAMQAPEAHLASAKQ